MDQVTVDAARLRAKMADPVWKAKNLFGFDPWSKQQEESHVMPHSAHRACASLAGMVAAFVRVLSAILQAES